MTSSKSKGFQAHQRSEVGRLGERVESQIAMAQIEAFTSPLPPPEVLEAYGQASPVAVDRLITMIEDEQRHRHALALATVDRNAIALGHDVIIARRAQILGFMSSMAFLGVGVLLILMGQWQFGVSAFLLPMVMATMPLIHGRRAK